MASPDLFNLSVGIDTSPAQTGADAIVAQFARISSAADQASRSVSTSMGSAFGGNGASSQASGPAHFGGGPASASGYASQINTISQLSPAVQSLSDSENARSAIITSQTAAYQQQNSVVGDLGRFGAKAFDDMGMAMVKTFTQGKHAATSFSSVAESMISKLTQDFMKIMVLKPLEKILFGGGGGRSRKGGGGGGGGILNSLLNGDGGDDGGDDGGGDMSFDGGGDDGSNFDFGAELASAKGNIFYRGRLVPFAKGGAFTNSIVSQPTTFPMATGAGLMGEAGPEAVMPLTRSSDGSLGVRAPGGGGGGGGVNVVVNDQRINAGDAAGGSIQVQDQGRGPDGKQMIQITVQEAVNKAIKSGAFDKTMLSTYSLRRTPAAR